MSKQDKSGRQVCIAFAQFTSTYFATRCLKMVQVRWSAACQSVGLRLRHHMSRSLRLSSFSMLWCTPSRAWVLFCRGCCLPLLWKECSDHVMDT